MTGALLDLRDAVLAGAVVRIFLTPVERVTVPLFSCAKVASLGVRSVFHTVRRHEGWRGFFRGATIDVVRSGAARGATVGLSDSLVAALGVSDPMAGAMVGAGQTLLLYPLDVVQTARRASVGPAAGGPTSVSAAVRGGSACSALRALAARGGLRGLYPALAPSLAGVSAFYALQLGSRRPLQEATGSAFVGGFLATVMACGLLQWNNVVRLTMQRRAICGEPSRQGWVATLQEEYLAGGLRRFYAGFGLKVAQTGASMGATIALYEWFRASRKGSNTSRTGTA